MKDLLDRIESCNYECEAGPLSMNEDWQDLKQIAVRVQMLVEKMHEVSKTINLEAYNMQKIFDPLDQPDAE